MCSVASTTKTREKSIKKIIKIPKNLGNEEKKSKKTSRNKKYYIFRKRRKMQFLNLLNKEVSSLTPFIT